MPYTAQFFAEKLEIPVEYFNPLRSIQIDPVVNLEELARVAHSLGEVVGLGLRNLANCPVEMNLMPASTLRWQSLNQKKPYFVATVISLVLVAFGVGFLFQKLAGNKEAEIQRIDPEVSKLNLKVDKFNSAYKNLQKTKAEAAQITTWMQQRYYWGDLLADLRHALIRSEDSLRKKLSAQKAGADVGIWIEQMISTPNLGTAVTGGAASPMPMDMSADPRFQDPRLLYQYRSRGGADALAAVDAGQQAAAGTTNAIMLVCRAVSLKLTDPSANNKDIAYAVRDEIAASPLVNPDPKATQLVGEISPDDANGTFTFTVNVTPATLLKF